MMDSIFILAIILTWAYTNPNLYVRGYLVFAMQHDCNDITINCTFNIMRLMMGMHVSENGGGQKVILYRGDAL